MDYGALTRAELESELTRLRNNLEDLEDMVRFDFTFTSAHIGGAQVRRDEDNMRRLRETIARIEELLSTDDRP